MTFVFNKGICNTLEALGDLLKQGGIAILEI